MENKINIAEILRNTPKGTKLYSPLFGKCECIDVDHSEYYPIIIRVQRTDGTVAKGFMKDGRYFDGFEDARCLLFPSAKMRDWSKFFKRGDVVVSRPGRMMAIFEGWVDDSYTEFNTTINRYMGKEQDSWGEEEVCSIRVFSKATNEERAEFIAAAEKHYGGKYNPETLQVGPKLKCSFEPFQKVLVRDAKDEVWKADYFSHYEEGDKIAPYVCVGSYFRQCIPYEGSEHLLGTDKSPK